MQMKIYVSNCKYVNYHLEVEISLCGEFQIPHTVWYATLLTIKGFNGRFVPLREHRDQPPVPAQARGPDMNMSK